jgi:hypothetical protein
MATNIVSTPKLIKIVRINGGPSVFVLDGKKLFNSSILNTSQRIQYKISLVYAKISNRIYNVLGSFFVVYPGGVYLNVPAGYWTFNRLCDPSTDLVAYINTNGADPNALVRGMVEASDTSRPAPAFPGTRTGDTVSVVQPTLTVSKSMINPFVKVPAFFGARDPQDLGIPNTTFGLRGEINVVVNTQSNIAVSGLELSSATSGIPVSTANNNYFMGEVVISQGGKASANPVNNSLFENTTQASLNSPGIVIGTGVIPFQYQKNPLPPYEGPVIEISPTSPVPLCSPPPTITQMIVSLCDNYGNFFNIDGHVEIVIKIDTV